MAARRRRIIALFFALLVVGAMVVRLRHRSAESSHERRGSSPLTPAPDDLRTSPGKVKTDSGADGTIAPHAPSERLQSKAIRVVNGAGAPVRAKVLIAMSKDYFKTFALMPLEADDTGRSTVALDPRSWVVLSASAPGHRPVWRSPVTWGEISAPEICLEMAPGLAVAGTSYWKSGSGCTNIRLRFSPDWDLGSLDGQIGSKLAIPDDEVRTDAAGGFQCTSLRPGPYRISFPEQPTWPTLTV